MAAKKYKGYRQSQRPFTPAEDKVIKSMLEKGATGAEIAIKLKCHKGAVHRRLREMGMSYPGFWSALRAKQDKKSPAKKKAPAKAKAKPKAKAKAKKRK
jgi:DNA invertase Pin-like site-specific DNA recombinase